jgi:hypothetical protein
MISMAAQPMQVGSVQPRMQPAHASKLLASLPGNPAVKQKVIRAIEATNGRCLARDVSMRAEASDPPLADQKPLSKEQVMEMPGVTGPLGFFDPLGISTGVPEGRLLFFREAELKHGRVCMLAILGLLVGENHAFIPILGGGIDNDVPAYLLGTPFIQQTSAAQFWPVVLGAVFIEEYRRVNLAGISEQNAFELTRPLGQAPGDYGWDPLGLKPKDAKELKELQNKELNNGRLAMFAAAGIIAQEQVTGKNILR